MIMRLFDTHAHLHDERFDADVDDVVARSRDGAVIGLVTLGENVATSLRDLELARAHPGFVYAAAGCHPHDADSMDGAAYATIRAMCEDDTVVAVGEIGLDFYRNLSGREKQLEVFQWHLSLARDLEKPVAIHCREGQDEMLPIIEAWSRQCPPPRHQPLGWPLGVMHYFSGDAALGAHYAALGFMISIHTSITYPKSERLREVARTLPLDALVVETDSPYGAPQSIRGKRNEPAQVLAAVEAIAGVRGESIERVAEATVENALRLFRIDSRLTEPAGIRKGR